MATTNIKRVRLIDVAEKAGVSRIVAGHVLLGSGGKTTRVSEATADRVREIAKELDYQPNLIARQLSGVRTKTLAVLIGADRYTIHYDRMRAIDREADKRGYRLMVSYLHRDRKTIVEEMIKQIDEMVGRGVEGVILMHGFHAIEKPVMQRLKQLNLVATQRNLPLPNACIVDVDIENGVEQLLEHLATTGRKRPALILDGIDVEIPNPRLDAFKRTYHKYGFEGEPTIWLGEMKDDTNDTAIVRAEIEKILDKHIKHSDCDAIIGSNDLWGVQLIKALLKRGIRVPQDIAVTGIDNVEIAAASNPELTTIDQCNTLLAKHCMDLMINMIEGKRIAKKDRNVIITPELVVREST